MNKQEILDKLSAALDKIENSNTLRVSYGGIVLEDYSPDPSLKLCYRQLEVNFNDKSNDFEISDTSEPFKCSMGDKDCTERGFCSGDC